MSLTLKKTDQLCLVVHCIFQGTCCGTHIHDLGRVMRKSALCICENKVADQQRGNCAADQHHCFRYIDSTVSLLPKSELSSLEPSSVVVQRSLCWNWSETMKTGFFMTQLI